jgi:Glycosyl transferases group 1
VRRDEEQDELPRQWFGRNRASERVTAPSLHPRICFFATQGSGGGDEARIRTLLEDLEPHALAFERTSRGRSALGIYRAVRRLRPDALVMEGTGIAGGLAVLISKWVLGVPYFVSSGDAVGPFIGLRSRFLSWPMTLYEVLLYSNSRGVIGWTPYICGRALTFGARHCMTAAGWGERLEPEERESAREMIRRKLGIGREEIVFGIAGSLKWTSRYQYCYGMELVKASRGISRSDVSIVIIGDGDGLEHLEREAKTRPGARVLFTGRVKPEEVPAYLAALDAGSLPQSSDRVGAFRYSTKMPEYVAAGLPMVTGYTPAAYDLDRGGFWRLPGRGPWETEYLGALSHLLETIDREEIDRKRARIGANWPEFDRRRQSSLVSRFVTEQLVTSSRKVT